MDEEIDPIVVYIIVRESLNMSPGKIAAQVGHGIQRLMLHYFKSQILQAKLHTTFAGEQDHIKLTTDWLEHLSTKVVLRASEKEWKIVKEEFKDAIIITDLGKTEIEPGSETIGVLWPVRKSSSSKTIKRLQLL